MAPTRGWTRGMQAGVIAQVLKGARVMLTENGEIAISVVDAGGRVVASRVATDEVLMGVAQFFLAKRSDDSIGVGLTMMDQTSGDRFTLGLVSADRLELEDAVEEDATVH